MFVVFLYASIFVIALQALLLSFGIQNRNTIDNILSVFLIQMLVDVSFMFLFTEVFPGMEYVSTAAPFGLTFGPFLFWIYRILEGKEVSRGKLWLHFIPFLLGVIGYVVFLCSPLFRSSYTIGYYTVLYGAMCASWVLYPIFVLTAKKGPENINLGVFKYTMIVLLILTSFMLPFVWENYKGGVKEEPLMTGIVVIGAMLAGVSLIYWYMLGRLRVPLVAEAERNSEQIADVQLVPLLSPEGESRQSIYISTVHQRKIAEYLATEKYFDASFKLEQMAQDLNIPKSFISQYFTQVYSEGFVKTINSWRIARACDMLMSAELDMSMEELAFACGFNSRASFYRNFNLEKGCSPMVYREQNLVKL
ncbi:helix-turn-helix domain-containing protein [Sphingobacterium tabacisoli]|uniref:Helix-turn-helix domain-containing protein n=1 Tax=Sphingobacterium tabacisoli TaxID=2044855 RepID=A0ABW5L0R9_9SPHI|nr:helix-turn-helix domain-containing protein [Sphingobacterium tabacisoli]